jgi:hypothetical protein
VELVSWSCDVRVSGAVVACGVVLAEVVGFDFVVVSANSLLTIALEREIRRRRRRRRRRKKATYPVNLVEIVGQEHDTADNASAIGNLHPDIDMAEEEVEGSLDSRSFAFLADDESSTLVGAVDGAISGVPKLKSRFTNGEISVEGVVCQTRIGRASSCPVSFVFKYHDERNSPFKGSQLE